MYRRLFIILPLLLLTFGSFAQSENNTINKNHSVYGYFFYVIAKNIEWPENYDQGEFIIGVIGETPVTPRLELLATKKQIGERPIRVVKFKSIEEIGKCNMLFVPEDLSDQIGDIVNALDGSSTLVLSEKEGMAMKGSGINFITTTDGKVAFELNVSAVNKAKLKISAALTQFAIML